MAFHVEYKIWYNYILFYFMGKSGGHMMLIFKLCLANMSNSRAVLYKLTPRNNNPTFIYQKCIERGHFLDPLFVDGMH